MQASSRSPELMVPHSRLQRLEASHALEAFLGTIQRMQVEKRDAYFGAGKKYDLPVPTLIAKPQVFFSYAWGKENEPRFIQLQTFLKEMSHYLKKAGVQVWFDLDRMVGDVESQMRDGVSRSHVVLLFGTETYSKKTGVGSQTNVKKELDFTLEKAAHDKHCLMPLLLEGTFKTTFPSLGYKYLMVDATSWINLDSGQHDMQAYIKALTSLSDPVGILPAILGLQRMDDDYEAYRDSCRQDYLVHVSALKSQLEKIYASVPVPQAAPVPDAEEKQSSNKEPQNTTPLERWMASLAESIHSSEGSQKTLQRKEALFFEKYAFLAYEKAQTDENLLAPRTDCENTHQVVLQKLQEGKQAFVNQNAALLTVEMETQLREALLEREARVNQLENQRIVLESTRAELITELDAHKSKAGSLAQDISRQQAQQMSLVKDSVVLAERQNAKLEQLLQQVPASEEIKEYLSDCEELLSDIKSKTQELKRMSERDSPDFERCNGLMIDLGRYYQRCYVDIIRLMRQAGVAHAESDVKIEQAKAGQEIQEWKKRYDNSHVELAGAKQAYEETRRLLAEKEAHLSSLALRENTLSTELDKKQAVLEEALQRQEALEKEKAQVSELTRAQKAGWEEEQNKLRQQLQTIEKKSAEQSLKIEQLKEMEAEKAAAVKKAGEESEKSALKKVTIVQAEANVQVALQAEEMQKLKEELAAEKKKWAEEKEKAEKAKEVAEKLALEKAQIEAVRQSAEKIHVEQREKVKTEAQAEKVQVALQAEDMQKLKEKFAAMEAEAASAKAKAEQLAAEKAKVEADQKYTEKIQAEQTQKALDQKERQKAQVALQAEEILKLKEKLAAMETEAASAKAKAEQLMAEKAQIEADQKYVEKIQPEQAKRVLEEEERRKAEAEQAQKEQEKAEQRNKAVEEEKKEEGTEGRIKVYSHFFKPPKATPPDVAAFLRLVAEGEQDKAEALLKENPGLGVAAGSVTDLSKRTFKNITALQYALWALDWNMWMMLLKYIPRDEAQLQAMALEENGTEHGKHFDFSQLLGAYESYKQGYNGWDWNQRETHWCQQIGGAQLLLPAHVVNEYCRPDRAFYPLPDFTQIGLPRGREMNGKTGTDFFTHEYNGGRAGDKWAMYRGRVEAGGVTYHWIGAELAMDDAEAAAMIKEVRMSQRQSMIKELLSNKLIVAKKR